jgi:lysophospholipase L1-like esterase/Tfp pilus assembly protein PilF
MKKKTPLAFYVIAMTLPLLFFVMLELGLRGLGYGRDYRLFYHPDQGTPGMLYLNPMRSFKYFGDLKGTVFFKGNGFLEEKPENGFRVFVLGGSSAQGFPYARAASFPSQLQRRMEALHPEQYIEVINLGASAINSYTIQDILAEVLEQEPDLILIYAGHNEYYGALGPASSRAGVSSPVWVRWILGLKEYRTYQLMENTLAAFYQSDRNSANLMEDMIGQSYIEKNSDMYQAGIEQFEYNMKDILEEIEKAEVPLILSTLASNMADQKPFHTQQKDENGKTAKDYFKLGRRALKYGASQKARDYLAKAREYDGLRFRAPAAINQVIRSMAAERELPLVDLEQLFDQEDPKGVAGKELLCDHLHPNMKGYFLMSRAFYDQMAIEGYIPSTPAIDFSTAVFDSVLLSEMPFTRLDSIQSQRTLVNLLGNYPYIPKGLPNPLLGTIQMNDYIDELGAEKEIDSTRVLASAYYWQQGDTLAFRREINAMLRMMPSQEKIYQGALVYLAGKKLLQASYPVIAAELKQLPDHASKWKMLAGYFQHKQQMDSSFDAADRAIRLRKEDSDLYELRGYAALMSGQYLQADSDYTRLLQLEPDNLQAHHQRGVARFELKDFNGSVNDFDEVIATQASSLAFFIRGYAHYGAGDQQAACQDWQQASRMGHPEASSLSNQFCN